MAQVELSDAPGRQRGMSFGDSLRTTLSRARAATGAGSTRLDAGEDAAGRGGRSRSGTISSAAASAASAAHAAASMTAEAVNRAMTLSLNIQRTKTIDIFVEREEASAQYDYVIHPSSTFRTAWDLLLAVLVIYSCWKIPFVLCFPTSDSALESDAWKAFDQALDVICWCDIVLNFRTGYIHHGTVVLTPRKIARRYLRSWFLIDFTAAFPFDFLTVGITPSSHKAVKITKVSRLFKLLRWGRIVKYLRRYFMYQTYIYIFLTVFFLGHVIGCSWYALVAERSSHDDDMWGETGLTELYIIYVGKAIIMLFNVDSGDPETVWEYLVRTIIALIGATLIAQLVAAAVVSHSSNTSAHYRFRKKVNSVAAEMQEMGLPYELQYKVRRYYEFLWLNQLREGGAGLCHDLDLSATLRKEIALAMASSFNLKDVDLFANCGEDCMAAIIMSLRTHVFMPGEMVCRRDEHTTEMYYVSGGVLEVLADDDATVRCRLSVGDIVGSQALLTGDTRSASVRAATIAELGVLLKSDIVDICQTFPAFYNNLRELALNDLRRDLDNRIKTGLDTTPVEKRMLMIYNNQLGGDWEGCGVPTVAGGSMSALSDVSSSAASDVSTDDIAATVTARVMEQVAAPMAELKSELLQLKALVVHLTVSDSSSGAAGAAAGAAAAAAGGGGGRGGNGNGGGRGRGRGRGQPRVSFTGASMGAPAASAAAPAPAPAPAAARARGSMTGANMGGAHARASSSGAVTSPLARAAGAHARSASVGITAETAAAAVERNAAVQRAEAAEAEAAELRRQWLDLHESGVLPSAAGARRPSDYGVPDTVNPMFSNIALVTSVDDSALPSSRRNSLRRASGSADGAGAGRTRSQSVAAGHAASLGSIGEVPASLESSPQVGGRRRLG